MASANADLAGIRTSVVNWDENQDVKIRHKYSQIRWSEMLFKIIVARLVSIGMSGRPLNILVGGLLATFVGATYVSVIRRTSHDDIEKEFEREIIEEFRNQQRQER
jgi:hypothetical protein